MNVDILVLKEILAYINYTFKVFKAKLCVVGSDKRLPNTYFFLDIICFSDEFKWIPRKISHNLKETTEEETKERKGRNMFMSSPVRKSTDRK